MESISHLLLNSCDIPCEGERYIGKCLSFLHKEGEEFRGIFRHLTDEACGNIHDKGIIEITSNSVCRNDYPKNVVDYQSNNWYRTNNQENSEICFDFKDKEIQITSYSLKSPSWRANSNLLRSWAVEVSNDRKSWQEIDKHEDCSNLNGPNFIVTFNTKEIKSFYRFVRLRQIGKSWTNDYYSAIASIEFYGKLKLR